MIITKRKLRKILIRMKHDYDDEPIDWTGDSKTSLYYNCGCMNIVNSLARTFGINIKE